MTFKKGDRVHVEFDGVVDATYYTDPNAGRIWDVRVRPTSSPASAIAYVCHEHLTLAEPEYEVGAVYLDHARRVLRRTENGWMLANGGVHRADEWAERPLMRLVPEESA